MSPKNFSTMTPEEHRAASRKGGQARARKYHERDASDELPIMEREHWLKVKKMILGFLSATIPGSTEPDFIKAFAGSLLLLVAFRPPETLEEFVAAMVPKDVAHRASEAKAQQDALDVELRELGIRPIEKWLALREQSPQELMNALLADAERVADLLERRPVSTGLLDSVQ
jgi:hypothetical protein